MAKQTVTKTTKKTTTKKIVLGSGTKNNRCPTCGKFTKKK